MVSIACNQCHTKKDNNLSDIFRMSTSLVLGVISLLVFNCHVDGQEDDYFRSYPLNLCLNEPLATDMKEWKSNVVGVTHDVEWSYGNGTCSSTKECFGSDADLEMEPQLMPVQIQPGVRVKFFASTNMDIHFPIFTYRVNETGFLDCDFTMGEAIIGAPTLEPFIVPERYLQSGPNYFITESSDPLLQCRFGLRVNVIVKTHKCSGIEGISSMCSGQGRCVTSTLDPYYKCSCCKGYTGDYCSEDDGCADGPCLNGGTCLDMKGADATKRFACTCPQGWHGELCEIAVQNQCTHEPCENNATCIGTVDDYRCICPPGYTGHHCEVNIDDCQFKPCKNGVCVDLIGGHQCYCTPGYGGHNCDMKFSACKANPCKNGGYCIDRSNGEYDCHCDMRYTGSDCSEQVNLCEPSPCFNGTKCVTLGDTFECECIPGYRGTHCEIDINECESNPCKNGGKCLDEPAGYDCICPKAYSGKHCEYSSSSSLRDADTEFDSGFNPSQTEKLYIVAGTLAGALLIALAVLAICYCKVHETYRIFYRRRMTTAGGYTRHTDNNWSTAESSPPSTLEGRTKRTYATTPRPDPDAIMEASSHDHYGRNVKSPLVASLKPRRV